MGARELSGIIEPPWRLDPKMSSQQISRQRLRGTLITSRVGSRSLRKSDALHSLLYGEGSDGVLDLTIPERTSTRVTILGLVVWVTEETLGPLEAEATLDQASGSVKTLTVRAGDQRIAQRDAPPYSASARARLRLIAARPAADEDWTASSAMSSRSAH